MRATTFGRFCEVGARTKVAESVFGDYSYVVNDSDIIYTTLGKFCSNRGAYADQPRATIRSSA